MVFFKLTNPEEGRWSNVKEDFKKDLKKIEERFRQLDKDIFAQNFTSPNIKIRSEAEENLKKLLAMTSYDRDMITKVKINHLSDLNKEVFEEIEMVSKKIFVAADSAMSIAHEIGSLLWDMQYKGVVFDTPLQQVETQIKNELDKIKEEDKAKREEIIAKGEKEKQQIVANAMNARETFAQGFVNQLLAIGRAEIENKIREIALKKISNTEEEKENNS